MSLLLVIRNHAVRVTKVRRRSTSLPSTKVFIVALVLGVGFGPRMSVQSQQAGASLDLDQRLAVLEKGFQGAVQSEAEIAYQKTIAALDKGYAAAIDRSLDTAIKAGKTDEALAFRDEKKRLETGAKPPSEEVETAVKFLKELRGTYHRSLSQYEATRTQRLQPLFDTYTQALKALETELTKAGRLDDASKVKSVANELTMARASGNTRSPVVAAGGAKTRISSMTRSFTNSLGMKFVPVPGTSVLFCIHETRRKDYAAYAAANPNISNAWKNPQKDAIAVGTGNEEEPVVMVDWNDSAAFCDWLSKQEGHVYRLARDREWSFAIGIGDRERAGASPSDLNGKLEGHYPWGNHWPPPRDAGNFADVSTKKLLKLNPPVEGWDDGFSTLAPVMRFKPNKLGIYDLDGNVAEWCEDLSKPGERYRNIRGSSWTDGEKYRFLSATRNGQSAGLRGISLGFRCVVEMDK